DSGPGSLRDAIQSAHARLGPASISFDPGLKGTITLTGGPLSINRDLTISGPGFDRIRISGNNCSRVFAITGPLTDATLTGLTITRGRATLGGGILVAGSRLTLCRMIFTGNQAIGDTGGGVAMGG